MTQKFNYQKLRYRLDPEFRNYYKNRARLQYQNKREEIKHKHKLKWQNNNAFEKLKRRLRYANRRPEQVQADKRRIKEFKERKKFNGFTRSELDHIERFLSKDESKARARVYSITNRHYHRINRNGIPTVSFR